MVVAECTLVSFVLVFPWTDSSLQLLILYEIVPIE